jgi:hypothetical protein
MYEKKEKPIIVNWLAHHNPERDDFNNHVFYLFNRAFCIGCFSFLLGVIVALVTANLFYSYIMRLVSFPTVLAIFFICWIPSIFQYSIQIITKKPFKNRAIKFLIRFLYPIGSIIFIFNSPLWGFLLAVPAGYAIVLIRKVKNKRLSENV